MNVLTKLVLVLIPAFHLFLHWVHHWHESLFLPAVQIYFDSGVKPKSPRCYEQLKSASCTANRANFQPQQQSQLTFRTLCMLVVEVEWWRKSIFINKISPGFTKTNDWGPERIDRDTSYLFYLFIWIFISHYSSWAPIGTTDVITSERTIRMM